MWVAVSTSTFDNGRLVARQTVMVEGNPPPNIYHVGWYVDVRKPDGSIEQWLWAQPYATREAAITAYVDREKAGKYAALWNGEWIKPALLPANSLSVIRAAQGCHNLPLCDCVR